MVGPSGSGKSSAWRTLLKALENLEGVEGVAHVVDPKVFKDHRFSVLSGTCVVSHAFSIKCLVWIRVYMEFIFFKSQFITHSNNGMSLGYFVSRPSPRKPCMERLILTQENGLMDCLHTY